jgi:hypothetical protein
LNLALVLHHKIKKSIFDDLASPSHQKSGSLLNCGILKVVEITKTSKIMFLRTQKSQLISLVAFFIEAELYGTCCLSPQ